MRTLLDWYRTGEDIDRRMPLLSTYLGHVDPASTYWYLEAVPELLALVGERMRATARCAVMTALAPALQAFFTDRLITQRDSSPQHDRRLPRHVHAAAALRARPDRQAAVRAGHR